MAGDRYYDAVMERRLAAFLEAMDWQGLIAYLDGLSNKDFRMAGRVLGERLLPVVGDGVFWAEPVSNVIGGTACFVTMMLTVWPTLKEASA